MTEVHGVGPEVPDVSRETQEALKAFGALVKKWTVSVNLVAKSTVSDLWTRHIVDSMQVFRLVSVEPARWLDLGSGGGFPGIVCALLSRDAGWQTDFTLVESDQRKCAFLATARRELGLSFTILPDRIEKIPAQNAQILTARALAPLDTLFSLAAPHLAEGATLLLPKGSRFSDEIATAERQWRFTRKVHQSITEPEAAILECSALSRR